MSKMTIDRLPGPDKVHGIIRQHLIGDGFSIVFDLERSEGSWIVDAQTGEKFLDFYSFFASLPLGFNHPAFHTPENRERLLAAAVHKPSNSDAHSPELASFLQTFSHTAMREGPPGACSWSQRKRASSKRLSWPDRSRATQESRSAGS